MEKKIDILYFRGMHRCLGMDVKEVKKISSVFQLGNTAAINTDYLFTLHTFFADETPDYESLLYIEEALLGVPGEIEILKVPLTGILLLPSFIMQKQEPLFCWGFFKHAHELAMLITLSEYIKKTGRQ